jgi:CheY-like chemotaxis protein
MSAKTVLIVEDNELNMKLVKALLGMEAFQILEAGDAERGLEIARGSRPDLILMDIQLPGMDGLTAISILKKDDALKAIPVLALTSYAMEGDAKRARDAGADGYITKPIDTRAFRETIRNLLTGAQPGAGLSPAAGSC